MNAFYRPAAFIPGHTNNLVSNEMIVANLSVSMLWPLLRQPLRWPE